MKLQLCLYCELFQNSESKEHPGKVCVPCHRVNHFQSCYITRETQTSVSLQNRKPTTKSAPLSLPVKHKNTLQISALKYFRVPATVNKWYDAENQHSHMGRTGNATCLYLVQLCKALLGQFNVWFLVCTCILTHIISSAAEPEILLLLCAVQNFSCSCPLYIFNKIRMVT